MTLKYVSASVSKLTLLRGVNVVLTGGPSVGKTTIAERLKSMGFLVREEMASVLIQAGKRFLAERGLGEPTYDPAIVKLYAENGLFHPMVDNPAFQDALCSKQLEQEKPFADHTAKVMVVFDRALPDNYAYCEYYGVEVPAKYRLITPPPCERYDLCFVLESFNKFVDNGIRVEKVESGADFAKVIGPRLSGVYQREGVPVIHVPAFINDVAEVSIKQRQDFIWQQVCDYANKKLKALAA
jgi:predicted ATPase